MNTKLKNSMSRGGEIHSQKRRYFSGVACFLLVGIFLSGCATDAPTDPLSHSQILVFPLLDLRNDKSVVIECTPDRPLSPDFLGRKTQSVVRFAVNEGLQSNITYSDLAASNAAMLKKIPTKGEQYAFFLCLSQWEFGATTFNFNYDMSAFLVRTSNGEIVWKNRSKGSYWEGILQGPLDKIAGRPQDFHYGNLLIKVLKNCPSDLPM